MANYDTLSLPCNNCGNTSTVKVYRSVNVSQEPALKGKVTSGELFIWECPSCGRRNLIETPFLYQDPDNRLMILLSKDNLNIEGDALQGMNARLTGSIGELIEKVNVFDAGLDDVVVEMCKYVTVMEMGKECSLKFFKMDGADNDMIFTYPKDGQMEMISVGFNVYEDCRGIVSRNPILNEKATGFVRIDQRWLTQFIG